MKKWKHLEFECCPECGSDLEVLSSDPDDTFYDGDEVRCNECDFRSAVSVDEDGTFWVQTD